MENGNSKQIQIVEKPEWVSWDDIKQCLEKAHSINRARGVNMVKYRWPVSKIQASIGANGHVLVALNGGGNLVGVSAIGEKVGKKWYAKGNYAYMSLSGVLPEYNGQGIFSMLDAKREQIARERGITVFIIDTHQKNKRMRAIKQSNGYKLVDYFAARDHYNVVMAKWPKGCPYSDSYRKLRCILSYFYAHLFMGYYRIGKSILNIIKS